MHSLNTTADLTVSFEKRINTPDFALSEHTDALDCALMKPMSRDSNHAKYSCVTKTHSAPMHAELLQIGQVGAAYNEICPTRGFIEFMLYLGSLGL